MKNYSALALLLITALLGIHCTAHAGELAIQTLPSQEESIFHSLPAEIRRHIVFLALALAKQYGDYEYTKTILTLERYCGSDSFSMLLSPDGMTLFITTPSSNNPEECNWQLLVCDLKRETVRKLADPVEYTPEMTLSSCGSFLTTLYRCSVITRRDIVTGIARDIININSFPVENSCKEGTSIDGALLFTELKEEKKGPFDPEAEEYLWNTKTGQRIWRREEAKEAKEEGCLLRVQIKNPTKIQNRGIVWDTATRKQIIELKEYRQGAYGVGFSPDKKTIALCTRDRNESPPFERLGLWNLETGELIHTLEMENYAPLYDGSSLYTPKDLSGGLGGGPLIFSPSGNLLMVKYRCKRKDENDHPYKVGIWHVQTGKLLREFSSKEYLLYSHFSPDGDTIIIHQFRSKNGKSFNEICLWDLHGNRKIGALQIEPELPELVYHVVEIALAGNLFIGRNNGEVQLWSRPQVESTFQLFKKLYSLFHLNPLNETSGVLD